MWYLPHHPVMNPKKPEKLEVVFDCGAKYMGTCLNDAFMQGPNLTSFRRERIAVTADVRAMFNQVRVDPKKLNALRFLWWPNEDLQRNPVEYHIKVHLFGAASLAACASFCLRQSAKDFGRLYTPLTSKILACNFYVDDCLVSFETETEAICIIQELTHLSRKGGFHLTKWSSNNSQVLQSILEKEKAAEL